MPRMKACRTLMSVKIPWSVFSSSPVGSPVDSPSMVRNFGLAWNRCMSSTGVRSEMSISPRSSAATRVEASGMKRKVTRATFDGPLFFMNSGAQL